MILTTIAIIWLTSATIFVLALAMSAAKPVPRPEGLAHDLANFSLPEESDRKYDAPQYDAPQSRLYCGRSLNLLNDRSSAEDFEQNRTLPGRRGGMTGLPKENEPARKVSF